MLPTEPIGSVPRPQTLLDALAAHAAGELDAAALAAVQDEAVRDSIARMEQAGSPVVTDGEQTKPSFATYPLAGLANLAPDGVQIPFADGHVRQLPRLTSGPFRYAVHADAYLGPARRHATVPVKQAVIAASALSLLYPADGIDGYPSEQFIDDLVREAVADIRRSLDAGAHCVQIDFTEGRLAVKLDPSLQLLDRFVALNNRVLGHFSAADRSRIGVHTCPGGDQDATHSADVDYAELLPKLFDIDAGAFYLQMASEADPERVLAVVGGLLKPHQRVFVGVTDPIDPTVETIEVVRDRVLQAARHIPVGQLGTTDDCGFAPFADDVSTSRDIAFAKIAARIAGTRAAEAALGI
ncbi:MAG: cobalamin-independent methionine synthase II family protein [Acidimicrobiia bacterium]